MIPREARGQGELPEGRLDSGAWLSTGSSNPRSRSEYRGSLNFEMRGWDQQEDRAQSCVPCWPRELPGRAKWGVLGVGERREGGAPQTHCRPAWLLGHAGATGQGSGGVA